MINEHNYFGHEEFIIDHDDLFGGDHYVFEFPNQYGASVVCHSYSYGGDKGLWELAVLYDGALCYDTPITDDVVGYLEDDEVKDLLEQIKNLPAAE